MLGVQRTTVTAVAGSLKGKGLIRYRRGVVDILDRPGLEAMACECYGAVRRGYERLLPLAKAKGLTTHQPEHAVMALYSYGPI